MRRAQNRAFGGRTGAVTTINTGRGPMLATANLRGGSGGSGGSGH